MRAYLAVCGPCDAEAAAKSELHDMERPGPEREHAHLAARAERSRGALGGNGRAHRVVATAAGGLEGGGGEKCGVATDLLSVAETMRTVHCLL